MNDRQPAIERGGLWLPIRVLKSFKMGGWRCSVCGRKIFSLN